MNAMVHCFPVSCLFTFLPCVALSLRFSQHIPRKPRNVPGKLPQQIRIVSPSRWEPPLDILEADTATKRLLKVIHSDPRRNFHFGFTESSQHNCHLFPSRHHSRTLTSAPPLQPA